MSLVLEILMKISIFDRFQFFYSTLSIVKQPFFPYIDMPFYSQSYLNPSWVIDRGLEHNATVLHSGLKRKFMKKADLSDT